MLWEDGWHRKFSGLSTRRLRTEPLRRERRAPWAVCEGTPCPTGRHAGIAIPRLGRNTLQVATLKLDHAAERPFYAHARPTTYGWV